MSSSVFSRPRGLGLTSRTAFHIAELSLDDLEERGDPSAKD